MGNEHTYIGKMMIDAPTMADKIEIMFQMQKVMKKRGEYFFFDKTTVFKTEIARIFTEYAGLNKDDANEIVTAALVCNCKKRPTARTPEDLKKDVEATTEFLTQIGFSDEFCYNCEQLNRYTETDPRTPNGDVLELTEQMGGLLLDRPEREGFPPEEALTLIEERNLKAKGFTNIYLKNFKEFIGKMQEVEISGQVGGLKIPALARLKKLHDDSMDLPMFANKLTTDYSIKIDEEIEKLGIKTNDVQENSKSIFKNEKSNENTITEENNTTAKDEESKAQKWRNSYKEDVDNQNRGIFTRETQDRYMGKKESVGEVYR